MKRQKTARRRKPQRKVQESFPYGGVETLRMIDDLLSDCGVLTHCPCDVVGCATARRYVRLRSQAFRILLFENAQRRKAAR